MQPIKLFTIKDIPVYFQPMFVVLILILSWGVGSVGGMILFSVSAIIGLLAHEFGHALMAKRYHLHPEITLTGFGGNTRFERSPGRKQDFLITLMGPLTNLIIGCVSYGLVFVLSLLGIGSGGYVGTFLVFMWWVNLFWGVFNLLPAKPMDGYKVFNYALGKFVKRQDTLNTVCTVTSLVFVGLILAWSIYRGSLFMIIMSGFFVMANLDGIKSLFGSRSRPKMIGIQAEALYEKGLVASRNHDWKNLEMLGHQMKKVAEGEDQVGRAYELLTIANTNLGKYEDALKYSEHARQSDPVKKAILRCRSEVDKQGYRIYFFR